MPVRNGGHYVVDAIQSLLAQSHQDWRVIVLENGSKDATPAFLQTLNDARITVSPAREPLDIHANWHRGFDVLADIDPQTLVTFLGHDDLFYPHFLEHIASLAEQHPTASLYQTHFDLIDGEGRLVRPCRPVPHREEWADLAASLCWFLRDSFGTGYVFRAGDYRQVGGIPDTPMLLYADHLVWLRLTRLRFKVCAEQSGFAYRRHGGSTSGLPTIDKWAAAVQGLHGFIALLTTEFEPFARTDRGQAAMAALLARELSLLHSPLLGTSLPPADRALLRELDEHYRALARGVPIATLAGMPYSPAKPFLALRQLNATQAMLRHRLFGKRR